MRVVLGILLRSKLYMQSEFLDTDVHVLRGNVLSWSCICLFVTVISTEAMFFSEFIALSILKIFAHHLGY